MIWQKFKIKISKWRKEDSIGINRKINIFKIVNTNFEFFLFLPLRICFTGRMWENY